MLNYPNDFEILSYILEVSVWHFTIFTNNNTCMLGVYWRLNFQVFLRPSYEPMGK